MTDPLLAFRAEFPILERCTYLVSNSLGAMPRGVPDRLAQYVDEWAERGVRAWGEHWWHLPLSVGDEIAPLIGARAGEIVMAPNVSFAQGVILSAMEYSKPRDGIVMTALDFPSVRYVYDELAPRLGARITVVPSDDGITIDADRICAAIDERTRLVCISHVFFRSAFIVDVARVAAHARRMGALVSLDAFHSVGVMPVDVRALGVDFLTGGVLKWLCGGPGGCFLWASPDASERHAPAFTGWMAHARPFAFEPEMEYAQGAARWLGGTPAIPAIYAAIEGPRVVKRAGISAIREKSVRQTSRLVTLASGRGWRLHAPLDPAKRGGTVAVDVPHAAEVAQELIARDVVIDFRPGAGIRIAPHFYSSDDEIERAVGEIDDILRTGAWSRHAAGAGAGVT